MSDDYHGDWVMSSIIEDRAERLCDRTAAHTETGALSWAYLRDRAQRAAALLASLGVKPGDRVATMLEPTPDYLIAWFACSWMGAVEVPVNTDYKGPFLELVLRESQASVLILRRRFVERVHAIVASELLHLVVVGDGEDDAPAGKQLYKFSDAESLSPLGRCPRSEQDLLYILYTSGTTGPSKGVMHCNRSALWTAHSSRNVMALQASDVGYSFFPLFHVASRSAIFTACMLAGASTALRERFSVANFWPDVHRYGATFMMYMGSTIHFLCQQPPREGEFENSLRVASGAAASPALIEQFERRFGCRLLEIYGMTEIGTTSGPKGGRIARGTMGRPLDHLLVEIHDENDAALPPDVPGEIAVRPNSPFAIMQGYWRQPEATLQAWRNLWFHTGDLGKLTADGDLVFIDRLKDSMRRHGENISSFEVERAVQAHPDIEECAAFAIPSEASGDEVMIAVVLREGRSLSLEELHSYCANTLPRFAVPRYVRIVAALPKTPTGRLQKHLLRAEGVTSDTAEREARKYHG
jgi:carnitine-CoA ligase